MKKHALLLSLIVCWPGVARCQSYINPDTISQSGDIILQNTDVYYNPYTPPDSTDTRAGLSSMAQQLLAVFIRVRGVLTGIPDDDSLCSFECEDMYGTYPSYFDSTIGPERGTFSPVQDSCLQGAGPFPNPAIVGVNNTSILVNLCQAGATITATVFDNLGNPVGSAISVTSTAEWQKLTFSTPPASGVYYILVTASNYQVTLPFTVTN